MWLWLAPAVLLSQEGRQSRNSSIIASCDQGCITWGPITSCANNVLTDAGGLLLLLPANLGLIILNKLEVKLPFKDTHPTPTEISRKTAQQGWGSIFPWMLLHCILLVSGQEAGMLGRGQLWCSGQEQKSRESQVMVLTHALGAPPPPECCLLGGAGPGAELHIY